MKANFKVPHATSNKPKKPHQGSDLCEISNYASRASSFPKKFVKLLILFSAGTYPDVSLTRARLEGIKSRPRAVRSLSTAGAAEQDWSWWRTCGLRQRRGGGRSGAGGGQARLVPGLDGPRQYSGAGGGRVDPGSTAEQKYRSRHLPHTDMYYPICIWVGGS